MGSIGSTSSAKVSLSHLTDSVSIGDGIANKMSVNPDGSINVNLTSVTTEKGSAKSYYSDASGVSSGVTSTVLSYTVPVSKVQNIIEVIAGGSNIAVYELYINSTLKAKKRTYFGDSLSCTFYFGNTGFEIVAGDLVEVKATSQRPGTSDFECELVYAEALGSSQVNDYYSEISGSVSGVDHTIYTYTAPLVASIHLLQVEVSGDQTAKYKVEVNSSVISTKRTYFGSSLNENFIFESTGSIGLKLLPGDTVAVKVNHSRSSLGNFSCRISTLEA